jgi:hypothetical protein
MTITDLIRRKGDIGEAYNNGNREERERERSLIKKV